MASNHDCSTGCNAKHPAAQRAQQQLKSSLADREHVHYLEDSGCEVQGLRFYGSPWTIKCGTDWVFQSQDTDDVSRMPSGEVTLGQVYDVIPETVKGRAHVLVTHQPPLGHGDTNTNKRSGSKLLLERVQRAKPLVHVFGHIHSGYRVSAATGTVFVNAAMCDDDYQPIQPPILVQLRHCL